MPIKYKPLFSFAGQQVNRPLVQDDGTELPYLVAIDEDGGIYGDVSFEIADNIVGKLRLRV